MQANELRIGNWVLHRGNQKQVDYNHIGAVYEGSTYYAPIPLTPEILEECGFEFDSDRNSFVYKVKNDYVEYYEAVSGNQLSLCCDEHNFYLPLDHITSLHQLQNFIYFTFNTELQWNRKQ